MKLLYTLICAMTLTCSALADESPLWLTRYVSVTTESGITGYPAGTIVLKENGKFLVDKHVVPKDAVTDDLIVITAVIKAEKERAALVQPVVAPKVEQKTPVKVDSAPKKVYPKPHMSALGTASLQTAGSLGGSGVGSGGSIGGTHSRTASGFYINKDGSLGKRAGEK